MTYSGSAVAVAALAGAFLATVIGFGLKIRDTDKRQMLLAQAVDQRIEGVAEGIAVQVEMVHENLGNDVREAFEILAQIRDAVQDDDEE